MKSIYTLLLAIATSVSIAQEKPRTSCGSLFQSWVFNVMIEETCEFGGVLRVRLGSIVKAKCDSELPESLRNRLGLAVKNDVDNDYKRMGHEAFCRSVKPGYDEVVAELAKPAKK